MQVATCLDQLQAEDVPRDKTKPNPKPGVMVSVVRQDYEAVFGQDFPINVFPECTKVSHVIQLECGDIVQPHTKNPQLYLQVRSSLICKVLSGASAAEC